MQQENGTAMSEQVYEHLKNMILTQQIKPGERRGGDGIVTLYPNRFAEVTVFPKEWLQEVGIVRLALDTVAAHLAILYGSNYDYSIMESYNERCLAATRAGDRALRIRMNCSFHLELSRFGKNA